MSRSLIRIRFSVSCLRIIENGWLTYYFLLLTEGRMHRLYSVTKGKSLPAVKPKDA
jgi:hypothetical protein